MHLDVCFWRVKQFFGSTEWVSWLATFQVSPSNWTLLAWASTKTVMTMCSISLLLGKIGKRLVEKLPQWKETEKRVATNDGTCIPINRGVSPFYGHRMLRGTRYGSILVTTAGLYGAVLRHSGSGLAINSLAFNRFQSPPTRLAGIGDPHLSRSQARIPQ